MKTTAFFAASILTLASVGVWAQTAGPNDAQIAAIVVTANQVDIDAGKLAKSKSLNQEVKEFAQRMITDHTGVNKAATELVTKLKVKPEENPTSKELKAAGDATLKRLKGLKGSEFDKAYIDNEVTYHQTVIDALDKTLIPSAKNEELKALLVKVRPAFVAHLEHAKHTQASFKK
jgi:putative membrane protein